MARTHEDYLRWQLGKWRRYAPNITLLNHQHPAFPVEPGELAIARVTFTSGKPALDVTSTRLVQSGSTLLMYADVHACEWIDRDPAVAARLKHSHFQRLIVDLNDGREVVLDGLGQAVFPLLRFFWFKLGRGRDARAE